MSAALSPRGDALRAWMLLAPATVFLVALFLVPLGYTVWMSVSEPATGFDNYRDVLASGTFLRAMARTFVVALMVTLLALLIAYPAAYYAATRRNALATAVLVGSSLCFWLSLVVRSYAWMVLLGNRGPVTGALRALGFDPPPPILFTNTASMIGMVHVMLPYMILSLYAVMVRIDGNLGRAAASLGAPPGRAFRRVFLPLSLPGIANGCLMSFIFCLGFYVLPAILGSPSDGLVAGLIEQEVNELLEWGLASAMATLLLGTTAIALIIYDRFLGLDRLWG